MTSRHQLAEGGRLVTVVKPEHGMGQAVLMTRAEGVLSQRADLRRRNAAAAGFPSGAGLRFLSA